jgi:hypothetical protein
LLRPAESIGIVPSYRSSNSAGNHGARFAYEEFFHAKIRNVHTLAEHTAVPCSASCSGATTSPQRSLQEVSPADVGIYLDELKHVGRQ